MNDELRGYLDRIEAVKRDAQALVSEVSEAQFNWRPGPERWSIGDCLVHLNLAMTITLPAFDRAIERGRARGFLGQGPFRYGWFATWMARGMEPPPKWRTKTFKVLRVPSGVEYTRDRVLPEFLKLRDQLAERVRRADGLDLKRVRTVSPVSSLLRLPLGAYFWFAIAHDRRHLWQAHQVRAQAGYPGR